MDQSTDNRGTSTALSGIRVVELSEHDAGASCGEFLAWYGADVVKVEPPNGERSRRATTEKAGVDSYEFILLNANKRSVTCDLQSERGKQDLRTLIANADVVVEQMAPGAAKRVGLDYEAVKQLNPGIVFAEITGFGSINSRADYGVDDSVAQCAGGAASLTGYEGGQPLQVGATMAATGAALQCVQGILAALYQRRTTGRGQKIEVAMREAVINLTRNAYNAQAAKGKPIPRQGNGSRTESVPSNLFPCKPGGPSDYLFIHISKAATKHWNALLTTMGHGDLVGDARYATAPARAERRDEIEAMITAWCKTQTKSDAMLMLNKAGTPAGAIFSTEDLANDAHLRKRGTFVTVEHPSRGAVTMPGWPVKMSDSSVPVRAAPLLGVHTQEVLAEWSAPRAQVPSSASGSAAGDTALAGVKVLDLTHNEAGPSCTEALAWLGADVVKVEEPARGERGRFSSASKAGVDAHYFISLNSNKRSMRCDLKSERGKELLRKMIAKADIMIENMGPGTIERLGFGYEEVRRINPRIIFAQIKGFATDGPFGKYLCFDAVAQAAGGSFSVTGVDGNLPLRPGSTMGDTGTGLHTTGALLAALNQRLSTGRGQKIEMAMHESVINFCRMAFARQLATGQPPKRACDRNIYRCRGEGPNDYCYVGAARLDDEQWQRLLGVIGKQSLSGDARFATAQNRAKHAQDIDALLAAWCREQDKVAAMDLMQRAGVPAAAVFDTSDLVKDPELRKSGILVEIQHPVIGPFVIPGFAVKMSESHVPVKSAPLLGAHTEEVLAEWLGLSKQEIEGLRDAVVADPVK